MTDWAARIGWVVGLGLFVALVYWLMREGWKWRGTLQGDLPELPTRPSPTTTRKEMPDDFGPVRLSMSGRYHGSTTAGQWLDRIVAHGLGTRSRVELTLTDAGLDVVRPGAADFFVPAAALREARLDKGIMRQGPHRGRTAGGDLGARRTASRLRLPLGPRGRAPRVGRRHQLHDRQDGQPDGNGRRTMTTSTRGTTKVPAVLVLEDGRIFRGRAYGALGRPSAKRCSPPA